MTALIIDGRKLAEQSNLRTKADAESFTKETKRPPSLVMLLIGADAGSKKYLNSKKKLANSLGLDASILEFDEDTTQKDIIDQIVLLNRDSEVDAILVQLPLPSKFDEEKILCKISPKKDVDGLHPELIGRLVLTGDDSCQLPCTPIGILKLVLEGRRQLGESSDLSGLRAVVLGRSNLVGKPSGILLHNHNATLTQCHSKTKDLDDIVKQADILVVATGKPNLITGDMLKPGAIVIDVGITYLDDGKIVGDCDFESCKLVAGAITPVPGGVGPMTMAMLMSNVLICANNNKDK
jgi:methylenetetrahydrofolate dehydrogenase (NADP+) / methenyltetrahydrofolate cyclohydrolase